MVNFTTNVEYTGCNIATLWEAGFNEGDEFATFHQARKFYWKASSPSLPHWVTRRWKAGAGVWPTESSP